MWYLAKTLSIDPDSILNWKVSKFTLWSSVSSDKDNEDLFYRSVCVSQAVWSPESLKDTLGLSSKKTKTNVSK